MEAELRSSLEQINRNPFCERVCDSEHAPRNSFQVLERCHALVEIVERGAIGVVECLPVSPPQSERGLIIFSKDASRRRYHFARECFGFFEARQMTKTPRVVVGPGPLDLRPDAAAAVDARAPLRRG